jgi:hypothetical protein
VQTSPWFSKLTGIKVSETAAYKKGQQLVEDLKEKYDTSDHPMVHKVCVSVRHCLLLPFFILRQGAQKRT